VGVFDFSLVRDPDKIVTCLLPSKYLAKDLEVQLELVRVERDQFNELLDSGQLDIVMSGLAQTPQRMNKWRFAGSPMDLTLALLVPNHRRKDFATVADVRLIPNLTLGIGLQDSAFLNSVRREFIH